MPLIILILSNYLLTMYLVYEKGPFDIFEKIRHLAGINVPEEVFGPDRQVEIIGYTSNGSLTAGILSCHRCTSPYTAALVLLIAAVTGFLPFTWDLLLYWLSTAGGAIFLFEVMER